MDGISHDVSRVHSFPEERCQFLCGLEVVAFAT